MKKLTYIPFIICGMLVTQSCFKDNKDLFDLSASERLEARMNQTQDSLTSSQYGWVMDYYPDQSKTAGGYTYVMDFNENSKVFVGYELAKPEERKESTFEMVADEGPVLIFNTYNEYIHYFAAPDRDNYQGKGGDFEFVIMDIQPGSIKTKGKKSKNFMMMYRLDMPADEYLVKREETEAFVNNNIFILSNGNTRTVLTREVSTHLFVDENGTEMPYIYSNKGIRFMNPVSIGENSAQEFIITEDKNKMTSINNNLFIEGASPLQNMYEAVYTFGKHYEITSLSDNMKTHYDAFKKDLESRGMQLNEFSLIYYRDNFALYVNAPKGSNNRQAYYRFSTEQNENKISLTYLDTDNNGRLFLTYNGLQDLINLITTTHNVSYLNGSLRYNEIKWENNSSWIEFNAK